MKISIDDPSRLQGLLEYLRGRGCIAYIGDEPWTITALPHLDLDERAVMRIVVEWTAAERTTFAAE
jgi:hypothetical protein